MKLSLKIGDSSRGRTLVELLKQLPFVEIQKEKKEKNKEKLEDVFGLWKNRNITRENLREKAWSF